MCAKLNKLNEETSNEVKRSLIKGTFLDILEEIKNKSEADKRKVSAFAYNPDTDTLIDFGYNTNMNYLTSRCDIGKETFGSVVHAEEILIMRMLRSNRYKFVLGDFHGKTKAKYTLFVSHCPCWNCARLVCLSGLFDKIVINSCYERLDIKDTLNADLDSLTEGEKHMFISIKNLFNQYDIETYTIDEYVDFMLSKK